MLRRFNNGGRDSSFGFVASYTADDHVALVRERGRVGKWSTQVYARSDLSMIMARQRLCLSYALVFDRGFKDGPRV
jgi:hypothetical protein